MRWVEPESTGLCGIHSLYVAAKLLGCKCSLSELVRPEYVTGKYGSTLEDLQRAVEEIGLESRSMSGLSVADLSRLTVPAILHVRPRGAVAAYVHWVAYIGQSHDGFVAIVDPQYGRQSLSWEEVASRFDGTAILVSKPGTDWQVVHWPIRIAWIVRAVVFAACIIGGVIVINRIQRASQRLVLPIVFMGVVIISSLWNQLRYDGLLADWTLLARNLAIYDSTRFPEVTYDVVLEVVQGERSELLLDARYSGAFSLATIPGAMNYPLDISLNAERRLVSELQSAPGVIVFCESEGCQWSDHIARRLALVGIRKVSIYRQGHREWRGRSRVRENSTTDDH